MNANELLQSVFMWKPGMDIEVILEREGETVSIKTTTTKTYTKGQLIKEKSDATDAQKALLDAWLKS